LIGWDGTAAFTVWVLPAFVVSSGNLDGVAANFAKGYISYSYQPTLEQLLRNL
jgi:hypothetical protein